MIKTGTVDDTWSIVALSVLPWCKCNKSQHWKNQKQRSSGNFRNGSSVSINLSPVHYQGTMSAATCSASTPTSCCQQLLCAITVFLQCLFEMETSSICLTWKTPTNRMGFIIHFSNSAQQTCWKMDSFSICIVFTKQQRGRVFIKSRTNPYCKMLHNNTQWSMSVCDVYVPCCQAWALFSLGSW